MSSSRVIRDTGPLARRSRSAPVVGGVGVAALSAAAWFGWMGWDTEYDVDDDGGLFVVGAALVLLGMAAGTAVVAALTAAVRSAVTSAAR